MIINNLQIKESAIQTLKSEAGAIENLIGFVNDEFTESIRLIFGSAGRVIVTGVGKSAIICEKIVATFNSTGTPAIFMHAADAIHGDLGMVREDDWVMFVSKSGNTEEVKVLLPLVKRIGAKTIGLISNPDGYVALHADYVIKALMDKEADPNNLAPTTSTTVHLAMGDAMAISLLYARGFTSEDFAQYHPGGALGKQLYLKVEDIYPRNELPIVHENQSIKESIIEVSRKRLGIAAIVTDNNQLCGVFTDGDLRRMLQAHDDFSKLKIRDVMTTNPVTIQKGEYALRALNLMREKEINQLIVLEKERIVGFLHINDLLNEGIV